MNKTLLSYAIAAIWMLLTVFGIAHFLMTQLLAISIEGALIPSVFITAVSLLYVALISLNIFTRMQTLTPNTACSQWLTWVRVFIIEFMVAYFGLLYLFDTFLPMSDTPTQFRIGYNLFKASLFAIILLVIMFRANRAQLKKSKQE